MAFAHNQSLSVAEKISRAKVHLVLNYPFLAVMAQRLSFVEAPTIPGMATDGYTLHYNPEWVAEKSPSDVQSAIAHEALHIALMHTLRRNGRDQGTWDNACDHAVNHILKEMGLPLPSDALCDDRFKNETVDNIYKALYVENPPSNQPQGNGDGEGQGQGQGQGQGDGLPQQNPNQSSGQGQNYGAVLDSQQHAQKTNTSMKEIEQDLKEAVAQAATAAKNAGKLPGSLSALLDDVFASPQLPWRDLLREYMLKPANSDFSWAKGNRRFLYNNLYLPTAFSEGAGDVVVCIDTSGSLDQKQLEEFAAELNAIIDEVKPENTHVLYCDTSIRRHDCFPKGESLQFGIYGGGGTEFDPPFEWIAENNIDPEVFVYCTDGYASWPEQEPGYPTIWVINNADRTPPWGMHVQIESKA